LAKKPRQLLDIEEVLKEEDVFRLAIRGHSAVDDRMSAVLDEAFSGSTPSELKAPALSFRPRLALFRALTHMP
jgi:hypothetical protein